MTKWVCIIAVAIIGLGLYATGNDLNPDSVFCRYQIYQQSDTHFEVWWCGRCRTLEGTFQDYKAAKAFQAERCQSLKDFMRGSPKGKRAP